MLAECRKLLMFDRSNAGLYNPNIPLAIVMPLVGYLLESSALAQNQIHS